MPNATTDWFVVAGSKSGDGSRDKPFHDPWLALRSAGPGDVIHIAGGTYYGRYDRSSWVVDCPNLTILGGYNGDFTKRTPWGTPSVFAVFPGYEYVRENNLLSGRGDHSGLVLDGLFFDASGRNTYGEKPVEGLLSYPNMDGPIASFTGEEVTIKNCVFANSAAGAVELSGDGSRFENNLVINIIGIGMLDLRTTSVSTQPVTVVNNSFCFAHDLGPPCGTGTDFAIGIRVNRSAVIHDNVFVSCGNAAISLYRDLDRVSIDRNLFYVTPRDIVNSRAQALVADIKETNIDELEDVGLKSAAGNIVQAPGMTGFRTEWLDAYSRHLLANYVKPPREAANALRASVGLPALAPADFEKEENKGALAPRLSAADALAFRFTAKAGYHPVEVAAEIAPQPVRTSPSYRAIDWSVISQPDSSLANQHVELRAGLGFEQNTTLLADAPPDTHMGIRIYQPLSDDGSIYVLVKRHTLPTRQFEEAIKYTRGLDVESMYFVRGIYRTDVQASSRQKVTLVVESIVPAPLLATNPPVRPEGRDWFVKAGASGGDGTREKPFRDPFQALDKAEGGDAIHVAGGDYFGKLRSGKWKIPIRNLTLLGGYDAEFANRDPWANPTRFLLTEEERAKGTPEGTILTSDGNNDGLVLDGFIFDGAAYNTYNSNGALDLKRSPLSPLVSLIGGRAITVRNCLFINAACAGIRIGCPSGVFENNLVLNISGWSLTINADGPGPWSIRNNTILFACDPTSRAGTGKSSSDGTLFHLTGRAVVDVESNIFAFADNFGVRSTIAQQNVSFNNNVFAACLYIYLTDTQYLWADASSWDRRAVVDSGYAGFKGNVLDLPRLPVDSGFADNAITRLIGIPSRISLSQWKAFAAQVGSSVATDPAPVEATSAPVEVAKPATSGTSSISDLLASLGSIQQQMKEADARKAAAPPEPAYCPIFDWKKALALAQSEDSSGTAPGTHKQKLTVSFAAARPHVEIQYTKITAQTIDADHASLDAKRVELEVTEARSTAGNVSYFPADISMDDYVAYSVATAGDATRTRIAIIVRLDTASSKLLDRTKPTDKLRILGTARVPGNTSVLSFVVDSVETVES
jgi:hypothetical protein